MFSAAIFLLASIHVIISSSELPDPFFSNSNVGSTKPDVESPCAPAVYISDIKSAYGFNIGAFSFINFSKVVSFSRETFGSTLFSNILTAFNLISVSSKEYSSSSLYWDVSSSIALFCMFNTWSWFRSEKLGDATELAKSFDQSFSIFCSSAIFLRCNSSCLTWALPFLTVGSGSSNSKEVSTCSNSILSGSTPAIMDALLGVAGTTGASVPTVPFWKSSTSSITSNPSVFAI